MPLGSDKINSECREGPEARKKFGRAPRPRWFARILLVCPDKSASVYECVRSRRYAASQECHLMRTGFSWAGLFVVKKRRLPENRPPIGDLWPADRRLRGITVEGWLPEQAAGCRTGPRKLETSFPNTNLCHVDAVAIACITAITSRTAAR